MERAGDADSTPRRMPAIRVAAGLVAAAIIAAPGIAFVAGGRGAPIENRAPQAFTGLDDGWDSFSTFGRAVSDRLPLRERAVQLDGWADESIFREDRAFGGSATPQVIRGGDGFLFLAEALDEACAPPLPAAEVAGRLAALATAIEASGRDVVTMVAPDKSTIHPELIPRHVVERDCALRSSDELWSALDAAAIPGFVDLRTLLRDARAASGHPLYLRTDSHWDDEGAALAVRALLDRFGPGLFDDTETRFVRTKSYIGDLTVLRADETPDTAPEYETVRPGITQVSSTTLDDLGARIDRRVRNDGPPEQLVPGRTLLFIDSYGSVMEPLLLPYFADVTIVDINTFDPQRFAALIADADRVGIVTVERSTAARMANEIGSPPFVEELRTLPAPGG